MSEGSLSYDSKGEECCCGMLSHSNMFGPSLDEILIYLFLLLFPTLGQKWSGIVQSSHLSKAPHNNQGEKLNLDSWLSQETTALACEMSNLGMDTREPDNSSPTASMLSARRYVLRRLAELMAKKEELEMNWKQ